MYVTRVQLNGIRGFHGERAVQLALPARGSWTVLAGRNGAGKTTLLRALALALGGSGVTRGLVPDFSDWLSVGRPLGEVSAFVSRHDVDVWRSEPVPPAGELLVGLGWVAPPEADSSQGNLRPDMHILANAGQDPLDGPWSENPRGWFCAAYGPFRRLAGGSGEGQQLMQKPSPAGRMATLFHEDASLAEGITWLVNLHLRRLERRRGAESLLNAVMGLLSDGLLPDDFTIERVDSDGLWVTGPGDDHAYPLREMSDGYRAVAALVLDMARQIQLSYGYLATGRTESGGVTVTAPGVVLIDEVDAHLHISWQRRIGDWLRLHFPNIQFIVSSHSPYVCQSADVGGLIRLPGPGERRPPEVVSDELYQRIVYGSGDDAALSELFGLETAYSDRAEGKRQRLVELERKVYAGTAGEAETAEYGRLSELLSGSLETRVAEVAARLSGDR